MKKNSPVLGGEKINYMRIFVKKASPISESASDLATPEEW